MNRHKHREEAEGNRRRPSGGHISCNQRVGWAQRVLPKDTEAWSEVRGFTQQGWAALGWELQTRRVSYCLFASSREKACCFPLCGISPFTRHLNSVYMENTWPWQAHFHFEVQSCTKKDMANCYCSWQSRWQVYPGMWETSRSSGQTSKNTLDIEFRSGRKCKINFS